jgi:hypothetical protein
MFSNLIQIGWLNNSPGSWAGKIGIRHLSLY